MKYMQLYKQKQIVFSNVGAIMSTSGMGYSAIPPGSFLFNAFTKTMFYAFKAE